MTKNHDRTTHTSGRIPFFVSLFNPLVKGLLYLGMPMGPMTLLTVRGRITGKPRTTPVAIVEQVGKRYLASVYGGTNWVRNLRANCGGILSRGRHSEPIMVVELTVQEAAPVLKKAIATAPSFLRRYFDATPASPLEDFESEALHHPVFRVDENPATCSTAWEIGLGRSRVLLNNSRPW